MRTLHMSLGLAFVAGTAAVGAGSPPTAPAVIPPTSAAIAEQPVVTVTRPYRVTQAMIERVADSGLGPGPMVCAPLVLDFVATAVPPEGDAPSGVAFTPDGSKIVIAHRDSMNLVVFDAATRDVLQTIPLSGSPNDVAISADGVHAVTANLLEDTASIVDLSGGTETAVVPVGDQPGVVRITPGGATAVVGNTLTSDLSVIDIASATETDRIAGAGFAQTTSFSVWAVSIRFSGYEIAADDQTLVFPDYFASRIKLFDITAGTMTPIASAVNPSGVALSADGTLAAVSHSSPESRVTVVDVPGAAIAASIPTGATATISPPIAINPAGTKAVVAVLNAVRVVNLVTHAVSGDLFTGSPGALATTADGQYCVVGNYLGSLVSYASESVVANLLDTTTPDFLAASPAGPRAATAHILRKETMEVMNVSGPAGFLEEVVPTGPPPEGDKARGVALTSDGRTALVINNHSQNVTFIDVPARSVTNVVGVGERPGAIAITPDDATAVVANLDSPFASIIDVATGDLTNVAISRRGSQVAISPDGHYAYIPVVADGDGVWRIDLLTHAVAGSKIPTGNMGGIGYVFDQSSGMTLSHDGATLVTCGSFTNDVSIIDTASWTEVARVPVGSFPVRAAFSPDDGTIYVSNKNGGSVSAVSNAGPASSVVGTLFVADTPFDLVVNAAGTKLYVADFEARAIVVFNLPGGSHAGTIFLPQPSGAGQPVGLALSADGGSLYVAANGADYHRIDTATNAIAYTVNTGLAPVMLAYSAATDCGFMPSPNGDDGVSIVCRPRPGDLDCDGDVDFADLLLLLSVWGPCPIAPPVCPGDLNDDGMVGFGDILVLLANWG